MTRQAMEPNIVINGRVLNPAECMAVRVAVSSFRMSLVDPEHRRSLGEALADGYDHHLRNVERAMLRT